MEAFEKLAPKTQKAVSESFQANATVMGAGLSVNKFFMEAFEKFAPNTQKAVSESF